MKDEHQVLYTYTYMIAVIETYLSSSSMLNSPFRPLDWESERNSQTACFPCSGWKVPRNLHVESHKGPETFCKTLGDHGVTCIYERERVTESSSHINGILFIRIHVCVIIISLQSPQELL